MFNRIKFWCINNVPTILLSLGALCLYKPISIESIGAFFAVMGISMLINRPTLTYADVEEISLNVAEITVQSYFKIMFEDSQDEEFNPDNFPPFSDN